VTFSDSRIVKLVDEHFTPVWESVAPVKIARFELGDGKSVRGTVGGEIALYFCRPDGKVFDILPALHSPKVTLEAMQEALAFYRQTHATEEAVRAHHTGKLHTALLGNVPPAPSSGTTILLHPDAGTRALSTMALSKTGIIAGGEPIVVVEPGGLLGFKRQVHTALASTELHTPEVWKPHVFTGILGQELVGGETVYDIDTLQPLSLIEEH
jgi:hypothetical protein